MAQGFHLLIAGASFLDARGEVSAPSSMPELDAVLRRMEPADRIECGEDSLSMPWEIARARACGLHEVPGRIPWAAFQTGTVAVPCAWVLPCHWTVGRDSIHLADLDELTLSENDSAALLAAAAPYFQQDGITLRTDAPGRWLATGEPLRDIACASPDRAAGKVIDPRLTVTGPAAQLLHRLQSEMQMLFHDHPANEARQSEGLAPVNSFWIADAGALDSSMRGVAGAVVVEHRLRRAARRRDAAAHAAAWAETAHDCLAALLARLRRGEPVRLTLCGDRAAQAFVNAGSGLMAGFRGIFGRSSAPSLLRAL